MTGPFAKELAQRRKWWDGHLWLQMVIITGIVLFALVVVYGLSTSVLVATSVSVTVVFVVARALLWARRRSDEKVE